MGFVVHLHQLADSGVGVPLGGGKRAVAEQLLDGAQVGTVGEQMGGKGVAQRMRVKVPVDVHQAHVLFDDASDRARGQAAAGVVQEIDGLLLAHYVVRVLMSEAARRNNLSPRRLSFTGTLKILRCRLPECPKSNKGLKRWYEDLLSEIAEEVIPERRNRINPRVIKRKMSNWRKKRPEHRQCLQPTKKFRQSVVILS